MCLSNHQTTVSTSASWFRQLRNQLGSMPSTYVVIDLETTGTNPGSDLITQIGTLIVTPDSEQYQPKVLLNWPSSELICQSWLRERMLITARQMAAKCNMTTAGTAFDYVHLRNYGSDPIKVLQEYHRFISQWQAYQHYFVFHGGFLADIRFLEQHFHHFLRFKSFRFDCNYVLDTGLMEKASQMLPAMLPTDQTKLTSFYNTIADIDGRIPWSLFNHCVKKYNLYQHENGEPREHDADFDVRITNKLYKHFEYLSRTV